MPNLTGEDEHAKNGDDVDVEGLMPDTSVVHCLYSRVQGSGFRVRGPGLRVEG
jgi:hypothetical protein